MTKTKRSSERKATRAAEAVQRAIKKDNLVKEHPMVGKPVVSDLPEEAKLSINEPGTEVARKRA